MPLSYCDEFPFVDGPLDHVLTFCDLTTGPDGSSVSLAWRVREITARYGAESVTAQAVTAGVPEFERAGVPTARPASRAGTCAATVLWEQPTNTAADRTDPVKSYAGRISMISPSDFT